MKSRILNIIIIVLTLALIVFLLVKGAKNRAPEPEPVEETPSSTATTSGNDIPTPSADSWHPAATGDAGVSFNIPTDYYVSHPVIGGCTDVTSISTQTPTRPTVSIALVYKEGCVTNPDVTNHYSRRVVKAGYVFQTSTTSVTVLSIFDKIVASAEEK